MLLLAAAGAVFYALGVWTGVSSSKIQSWFGKEKTVVAADVTTAVTNAVSSAAKKL